MRLFFGLLISVQFLFGQKQPKPEATEIWEPEPIKVISGTDGGPSSDAILLFDGTDLSQWMSSRTGQAAPWTINTDGSMTVKPGSGDIETINEHGSIQLHLEWKSPTIVSGKGQGRGNSGIIFQRRYEIQILDSYDNRTYSNGQAASVYKQYIPLVNATRPPESWQEYDIIFMEPKFDSSGKKIQSGYFTVFHNGVLVQNHVEILGTTEYIGAPKNGRDDMPGYGKVGRTDRNLLLQDHGNLVSYRNIWMRKL